MNEPLPRLIIRGFRDGERIFEEHFDNPAVIDLPTTAERHIARLGPGRIMLEIEWPDSPDPLQRFFRFGSDAAGMIAPIAIDSEHFEQ